MRCVGGVAAAVFAAALSVVVHPARAGGEESGRQAARFLFFSGTDLWRHGGFMHGGMVWSPSDLDREGFVLKLVASGGTYRYRSGALGNAEVTGRMLSAAILPGWRFRRGKLTATLFAGLDLQSHRLSPDDLSAGLRGSYAGLRTKIEIWYEPSATSMLAADGSVSTIGPSYSTRLLFGWRIFDRFYLGPEVQAFAADGNYRQVRTGLHVTGLKTDEFEWSAGIGWATDNDERGSLYGKLGLIAKR